MSENRVSIGSDYGRRQAIILTNAGILLIWPLGTNLSEISVKIKNFSFTKMHLKMSSAKMAAILLCNSKSLLFVSPIMPSPHHFPITSPTISSMWLHVSSFQPTWTNNFQMPLTKNNQHRSTEPIFYFPEKMFSFSTQTDKMIASRNSFRTEVWNQSCTPI